MDQFSFVITGSEQSDIVQNASVLAYDMSKSFIKDNSRFKHLKGTKKIIEHWNEFKSNSSNTAKYWNMFDDLIVILNKYIILERKSSSELHLSSILQMITYI